MEELSSLMECIHSAVRDEVKNHPVYKSTGGEVRISFTPRSNEADTWLGGLSSFPDHGIAIVGSTVDGSDIVTYEFIRSIYQDQNLNSTFDHPAITSKTMSIEVDEKKGNELTPFLHIDIRVAGAENVSDDSELVYAAVDAIADWFDEPYKIISAIMTN